jgi:cob(I)alamin adenosyltransferase
MASKIYTKTGDKGTTSLIGGTKVPKSDPRIEAYGTVDELNSFVGLCKDLSADHSAIEVLAIIQDRLFTIGSLLALDPSKNTGIYIPQLTDADIVLLEKEIDRITSIVPPMKSFILPGGHPTVSYIHIARCICRRAERCCVRIAANDNDALAIVIRYLNRLSDYLFMLARHTGYQLKVVEVAWKPRTGR